MLTDRPLLRRHKREVAFPLYIITPQNGGITCYPAAALQQAVIIMALSAPFAEDQADRYRACRNEHQNKRQ